MLKARVVTAVLLLPPVLWAVARGGPALAALLAVVGLLAGWEAAGLLAAGTTGGRRAAPAERWPPARHRAARPAAAVRGACALGGALPSVSLALLPGPAMVAMAAGGAGAVMAAALAAAMTAGFHRAGPGSGWARPGPGGGLPGMGNPGQGGSVFAASARAALLGAAVTLWVGVPLAHALWLRRAGVAWLLVPLVILWVQDIAAFFVGRAVGRHRMAPRISPGKTWEGAAGGLAAGLLVAIALAGLLDVDPAGLLPAAAAVAVAGQAGDLFESYWKRRAGLKDSGALLPGHGGMLDRIDSLLPALLLFNWWMQPWR
ncbi:phosphatidate cytidylyltransferase [Thermaerobacter subterraneus]|uniref:Phosphatidate cytidylyltransferase n=1 Tax=Thermaerobacter subterraneus DSM 13965 TaxID=867903 RepID=K6NXR4_9FIRM|nr:phosphatidate cytidylyltransferase [Thermaerobacter subterraneus]EKP93650.1 CDP-diglyceride synthetase [Thermaerobacter subterraneus DSM 13965]